MSDRRYDWVFLDMDGTLADSLPVLYDVYAAFLARYGKPPTRSEFERLNGPALLEIVTALKDAHDLTETTGNLMEQYTKLLMDRRAHGAGTVSGAVELIQTLGKREFRLMLVTSSPAEIATRFIERHGWDDCFEAIVSGEQVSKAKPDPAIYRQALAEAAVPSDRVVVVEDAVNGVRSAIGAGLAVAAVACNQAAQDLTAAGAQWVVPDLHALRARVEAGCW